LGKQNSILVQDLGILRAWCTYKINGLRICATYFKRKIENNMDVISHVFIWAISIRKNILQHVFDPSMHGWL
jgi:hypothetical protein